ncbi:cobalt transporter CbiM [Selenomonas caprae]|uniref:Cobalt transporter CbiM n=1 Tax=Selenomonas caprae TaxID=2606905 RepID=A0A5D6WMG5_9FIRM|nr:cobalt transporter CbiM [Selenomonas caprae]TYZ27614.1 cobalt transporter CbiM [Selenomonas caprae]
MHIPENYLSPSTCAVFGAAMAPVWWLAVQKVKQEIPKEKMPLLGIGAAFSFLGMMFNLPLPGGTTGHAVGAVLLAILFGPWSACLAVSVALFVQALFFGDGGLLAFGANCFNMAFVMPFAGWAIYQLLKKAMPQHDLAAAGIGAYAGINLAALCAAIEFGLQPLLFTDAAGHALYCPYPLSVSIPAMMAGHLTLFGLAEVVFTTAILAFLKQASPALLATDGHESQGSKAVYGLLGLLILGTPLGLLATGTAWGEWDPEELAEQDFLGSALGYTPAGMEDGFTFDALFPDYAIAGLPESFGYILSAIIGTALLVLAFKAFASFFHAPTDYDTSIAKH